jgi:uncharacterized coiled-coil DUF342 family protein
MFKFTLTILVSAIVLVGTGCAGKDKPTPTDIEAQAFADLKAEIREVVSDADRAEQAIAITEELETSFDALRAHLAERSAKIQALNADYDAPKEDFIKLINSIQMDVERNQRHVSELHRKLVEVTTAEEWADIKKLRNATMEAAITNIQSG